MRAPTTGRTAGRPAGRAGLTLVETAVASGLLATLFALFFMVLSSSGREGEQVEDHSALLEGALLLQESLAWDLRRALDLGVLPPGDRARGTPGPRVVLPRYGGYDADATPARSYSPRTYRFDAAAGVLSRDGEPLIREGLSGVTFAWTAGPPTELVVTLTGEDDGRGPPPVYSFRLPAPAGTDPAALWRPAPWHRGARREAPASGPGA